MGARGEGKRGWHDVDSAGGREDGEAGRMEGMCRLEIEIHLGILRLSLFSLGAGASGAVLCCVAREGVSGIQRGWTLFLLAQLRGAPGVEISRDSTGFSR